MAVLKALDSEPMPKHMINPGVRDRLRREDLAAQDGKMFVITDLGRAVVAQRRGGRRRQT